MSPDPACSEWEEKRTQVFIGSILHYLFFCYIHLTKKTKFPEYWYEYYRRILHTLKYVFKINGHFPCCSLMFFYSFRGSKSTMQSSGLCKTHVFSRKSFCSISIRYSLNIYLIPTMRNAFWSCWEYGHNTKFENRNVPYLPRTLFHSTNDKPVFLKKSRYSCQVTWISGLLHVSQKHCHRKRLPVFKIFVI